MFKKSIIILTYTHITISIKHISLFAKDNFIFKFIINYFIVLFVIIINSLFHVVLTYNDLKKSINLSRRL